MLAVVLLAGISVHGATVDRLPPEPWLYAAGLIGIGVIATAARVVGQVGVLVFSLASVAGQLLGALALDALTGGPTPTAAVWAGTAVTFGAVALAARPGRRAKRPVSPTASA
jgi:bacterial/archaeal transporter family-2 protein